MTYRIEFSRYAQKQFRKLPPQIQQRLKPQIDALTEKPRPSGAKNLEGEDNQYRIRVGLSTKFVMQCFCSFFCELGIAGRSTESLEPKAISLYRKTRFHLR